MDAFEKIETVEDLFKDLDENQFVNLSRNLATFRDSLMKKGFTRREAVRLVEAHQKFTYDCSLEEYISELRKQEEDILNADEEASHRFDDDDSDEYAS